MPDRGYRTVGEIGPSAKQHRTGWFEPVPAAGAFASDDGDHATNGLDIHILPNLSVYEPA